MRFNEFCLGKGWTSGSNRFPAPALCRLGILALGFAAMLPAHAKETPIEPHEHTLHADTILINGRIFTADSFSSTVEAVAIADGKFQAVGTNADVRATAGPNTKVIDLKGRMAMPGITDMHIHPVRGGLAELFYCKFPKNASLDELLASVRACAAAKKPGEWIEGAGWNSVLVSGLNKSMLDKVAPDNPVFLRDNTNHVAWVNSAALAAARIDRATLAPPGGTIVRDPQSKESTGIFRESAMALIFNAKPKPDSARIGEAALSVFHKLNAFGVTSIQSAQASAAELEAFRNLEISDQLTIRIRTQWDFNPNLAPAPPSVMFERFDSPDERGPKTDLIDPDGAKIYADGVVLGAASPYLEPYETAPTYGQAAIDRSALFDAVLQMDRLGLAIMIHAIGDAAARMSLDAIEAARRANGTRGRRHVIAHTFSVDSADRGRAHALDVVFENSPPIVLYPNDLMASTVELLGRKRLSESSPIRSLLEAGDVVGYGSDWDNIPEPNPWHALQAFVTRQNPAAPDRGYIGRNEAVDLISGLEILTINGAFGLSLEKKTGSIEVGKDADMIVLSQNLFDIPAQQIAGTKVLHTILRGESVFVRQ